MIKLTYKQLSQKYPREYFDSSKKITVHVISQFGMKYCPGRGDEYIFFYKYGLIFGQWRIN